ncbi:MAG: PQQ-binding-like beta-propeller repeat protein [Pseudomonadota bacterium]|nr:PQQ-binding-like beta-propeller repeat protein [Pseudomonadota bacterium]
MHTMSTRSQPTPRWGWLLLLGGLTACGYNMPWGNPQATGSPAGSDLSGDTTTSGDADTVDPNQDSQRYAGVFGERFVKEGYGAVWSMRPADIDGNGIDELLYGGQGVVALAEDGQPLWTFDLPAVEEHPNTNQAKDEKSDDASDQSSLELNDQQIAEKLRFMGVHVRELRTAEGTVIVLDSANRIHRLDAATGKLLYTVKLQGDGNACDFALIDADGDTVPDFFPSGGRSAYSGQTGEKLWDADIDFTPSMVRSGNLDAKSGRELLLIGNVESKGEKEHYDICPSEKNALLAMHEGLHEGRQGDGSQERENLLPRPTDDQGPGRDEGTGEEVLGGIVAVDARGKTLYTGNLPKGEIYTASIYDLDGDDRGDVIVGLRDSVVTLDTQGEVVQEFAVDGRVDGILVQDLDGDDHGELIVHAYNDEESTIYGFGQDGAELWNAPLGARAYIVDAIDLDADGTKELITGLGYPVVKGEKAALPNEGPALAPTMAQTAAWSLAMDGPQELWRIETSVPARAFAAVGDNQLIIASGDAQLYKVSANNGEMIDTLSAGGLNHAMGVGDLDGDGIAEVVTGDVFGNVTGLGHNGQPMFESKLAGDGPAVITGIEMARHEEGGAGMFVVSGFGWRGENAGVLQLFDNQGNTLFSVQTAAGLAEAKFADLDGDGSQEIVVPYFGFRIGQPMGDRACGVMAYDLDGKLLWQMDVATCDIGQIAVGDSDGNGSEEVAFGDLGRNAPYHMALLEGDGSIRWNITSDVDDAVWLEIVEGGVVYGGRTEAEDGHVTVLEARDGKERWRLDMAGAPDPRAPRMEDSPFGEFAGSLFGQVIEDVNGDDKRDIAFTTVEGEIRVLDGANGELLWEESLEDAALSVRKNQGVREGTEQKPEMYFVGGPLAYVPGNAGEPGVLVVTGYDFGNVGSEAFAFRVDTGEVLGSVPLDEFVVGLAPATWSGDEHGISITTTYDTYGFDIVEAQPRGDEPRRPTGDQGEDIDDLSLD